jgi:hypothetical protein
MVAYREKDKRRGKIEGCAKKPVGGIHAMSIKRMTIKHNGDFASCQ